MDLIDIARLRLVNQHIAASKFNTAKEVVGWLGAMQAQDYAMVQWAVGVRLKNSTSQDIETALKKGEIIRTHLLRPTWHLVTADDIYWLLELTAAHVTASFHTRQIELGLTDALILKTKRVLEKALRDSRQLTREAIILELERAKIGAVRSQISHLLSQAELDGFLCSGAPEGGKPTYALLEERVPRPDPLPREQALATLAGRYFTSHGPATLQDFSWWSGLPTGEAKHALELVKTGLNSEIINSQIYWFANAHFLPGNEVYLLPAFDEFLISYKDRTAQLPAGNFHKAVSSNGIFWPVIVENGRVAGVWKRTIKKDAVLVEAKWFQQSTQHSSELIQKAAEQYGRFLGKPVESRQQPEEMGRRV